MNFSSLLRLVASIAFAQACGLIAALFTMDSISGWYQGIVRSPLTPPDFVFGPVWTALFTLMGIAAYLVWEKDLSLSRNRRALIVYGIQLFLNFLWSIFFFGLYNPPLALVDIILLWGAIIYTIILFNKISRVAALLLVPYVLWVSFASYLNYAIVVLN